MIVDIAIKMQTIDKIYKIPASTKFDDEFSYNKWEMWPKI